ncbi:MAG: response regulator [bacterium]|nr:response regulator [bacterium]
MPNILVIEDQKPVRDSISEILALIGCQTTLIGDGQVALEALTDRRFDLITLDLNTPSLDGLSLAEALSSAENLNHETPVIVISAYLSNSTLGSLQQLGIKHWLPKPFGAEELLDLVRKSLEIEDATTQNQ